MTIVTVVSIAIVGGSMIVPGQSASQENQDIKWLTGRDLDNSNALAITALLSDAKIRDRIVRFSRNQKIALFLDRRIDPSTLIDLSVQNATKEQFLWSVAEKCKLGICRIEDFYYFGPLESAASFPAVCQQLREVTSKHRRNAKVDWSGRQIMKTAAIVEPKKLLLDLANQNQFQIENLDAIEHDIWAGFELPRTTLQIRVAVLLVGFGKTFERNEDGTIIKIIDIPEIKTTEASIRVVENAAALAKTLRPKFPDVKLVGRGKRVVVSGPPIQIAAIQRLVVAAQKPEGGGVGPLSFTARAPRGVILATAAKHANLNLVYDKSNRNISKLLQEPIEVSVVNADVVGLVQIALQDTNLKYELVGDEIRISER